MRRDIPEPWAGWLIDAGYTSPNARRPIASARRLAEQVGVHPTTLMNMMHGATDTDPATVEAVAEALRVDVVRLSRQVGRARTERAPWVPPVEANLLSRRQQLALSELIRSMAEEREDRAERSAPIAPADDDVVIASSLGVDERELDEGAGRPRAGRAGGHPGGRT